MKIEVEKNVNGYSVYVRTNNGRFYINGFDDKQDTFDLARDIQKAYNVMGKYVIIVDKTQE